MNYDVTIRTIPERYATTVQMIVPRYEDEGMLWGMPGMVFFFPPVTVIK